MNVVVVGTHRLAGEADFPMLDLPKYGWEQYPELEPVEVAERCWRSDIIVTVGTPIDEGVIDKAFKLKLIIAAGEGYDYIDTAVAKARGITVCHLPGLDPADGAMAEAICNGAIATINDYLNGTLTNSIDR